MRGVLEFYKLDEDVIIFNDFEPRNSTQLLGLNKKLSEEIGWIPNLTGKKLIMQLCEDFEKYKYSK